MDKYEHMFDYAPVGIWEEDWSGVKILLDGIRNVVKPEEIGKYLTSNPPFLNRLLSSIKIKRVNKQCADIYNSDSKNELLIQPLQKTFSCGSYDSFQKEMESLYKGDTFFEQETERITLSGEKIYIYIKIKLPTTEIEYENVIAIITDSTKMKAIQSDYLKTKNTFYQAFHNGMNGMTLIDMEGNIIEANRSFLDLAQYESNEIIGKNLTEFFADDIIIKKVFENKTANFKTNTMLKRKDHKDIWVLLGLSMVADENCLPIYFVGQIVDINNEKTTSNLLEENVRKYQQLLDHTNAVYLILDSNGEIIDSSDTFNALFNLNQYDMSGKSLRALISAQSMAKFDKIWACLIKGQTINAAEISLEKKSTFKWFNCNASMFSNGVTKIFVLLTDITDKKQKEMEKLICQEKKRDKLKNNIKSLRNMIHKQQGKLTCI